MAPPEHVFPVSQLPERVHAQLDKAGKPRSRKLPRDFDLRKCDLMELVQYSCTPMEESIPLQLEGKQQQCWPVVRLFRRCGHGKNIFHVETTAWEGEGAWQGNPSRQSPNTSNIDAREKATTVASWNAFADYGNYFWTKQK